MVPNAHGPGPTLSCTLLGATRRALANEQREMEHLEATLGSQGGYARERALARAPLV